ncbi:MAG: ribosomal L7Ae/L30e/S12e/Gadd45 family protein [Eubacteriales bacterium]|nr:ribosomal L7Ae/L30e/S12e/Gadd45 family protein [Eubacteriales bacterium]
MLERLKLEDKITGVKQTLKAVAEGRAEMVFVAADADKRVVSGLTELCLAGDIEIFYAETMKLLGKACGIDVGASAACILKKA